VAGGERAARQEGFGPRSSSLVRGRLSRPSSRVKRPPSAVSLIVRITYPGRLGGSEELVRCLTRVLPGLMCLVRLAGEREADDVF
jgi:hypothetical protein